MTKPCYCIQTTDLQKQSQLLCFGCSPVPLTPPNNLTLCLWTCPDEDNGFTQAAKQQTPD